MATTKKERRQASNWRDRHQDEEPESQPDASANGRPKPSANGKHKKTAAKPTEDLEAKAKQHAAETWEPIGTRIKGLVGANEKQRLLVMTREDFLELYTILDTQIGKWHKHLDEDHANAQIVLYWMLKPSYSGGKVVIGRTVKQSDLPKHLAGYDWAIGLSAFAFERLSPDQREAALDYLLCFAFAEEKKQDSQGNTGWFFKRRLPEVLAFPENVERFGLWQLELQDFAPIMKAAEVPNLFTDVNAKEPEEQEAGNQE